MPLEGTDARLQSGIRNLLVNCARAQPGDRLTIAYESECHGYFDADIRADVAQHARDQGLSVKLVDVGFDPEPRGLPDALAHLVPQSDVVLFLSRLGDQLRFSDLPAGPRYVVCFAVCSDLLSTPFGMADYRAFCRAKTAVDQQILQASEIVITCPAGTRVTGRVPENRPEPRDTTSRRFPMSVFSPVPATRFSGRVALGGFLTGTGSRYYEDYTVAFEEPIFALLDDGRLSGFDGTVADVSKAEGHYDRIADLFGVDRNAVHSWHAGIHPGCGFPWDMRSNDKRWGGVAFGNPRVLHFHTCGAYAPGEISWNVFDPTIDVDGRRLWDRGQFHLDRVPGGTDILTEFPCAAMAFADPDRQIGLV